MRLAVAAFLHNVATFCTDGSDMLFTVVVVWGDAPHERMSSTNAGAPGQVARLATCYRIACTALADERDIPGLNPAWVDVQPKVLGPCPALEGAAMRFVVEGVTAAAVLIGFPAEQAYRWLQQAAGERGFTLIPVP